MDLIQYIGSIGGITGVLAFIMFMIYRQDRKYTEERLTKLLDQDQSTREDNTKVLSELITWLKRKNGNS
ncbi:MAG: hypothetical protein MUP81_00735 [Dehalococcoidia bacterium]|nr:hypothetical protein [Dehalococcoidia bacterium]